MEKIDSPVFFIGKQADGLISFGSGQPDLPPPSVIDNMTPNSDDFRYGPVQGQEYLREALVKNYSGSKKEDFVITNGASEALDLTLRWIAKESKKKKFLIPRPYYYSYPHLVRMAGMDVEYYDLVKGKIDLTNLEERVQDCAGILINSPSNPTGSTQDVPALKGIEILAKSSNMFVISDEVYKNIIYDRQNYLLKGPKVVTLNSFSKTYGMCGFRVGYIYSKMKELVAGTTEIKSHTSMNTDRLAQNMAFEVTKVDDDYVKKNLRVWRERRDLIHKRMTEMGLDLWKPEGAFYVFPKFGDANKAMHDLFYKHKVITYDGAWFGDPTRLRFSYVLDKDKLEEGLRRVKKYLEETTVQQ